MMRCEECGARFEKALFLQTKQSARVVCPICKKPGPVIESELDEGMTARFNLEGDE